MSGDGNGPRPPDNRLHVPIALLSVAVGLTIACITAVVRDKEAIARLETHVSSLRERVSHLEMAERPPRPLGLEDEDGPGPEGG